jgi:hypothetical protein
VAGHAHGPGAQGRAAGMAGRDPIDRDDRDARTPGGAGGQLGGIVAIEYYNNIKSRISR